MEYRSLGRTGVKVSPLCLGCMNFGGKTTPEASYEIIDRAIDAGVNFLDTANVYSRGRSEEVTGEALKRNGKRDQVVLATKVHGVMDDDDPNARGNSRRNIVAQCEASLRRPPDGLYRPLPDSPTAARYSHRRDAAGPLRSDPLWDGALHRHQYLRRLAADGGDDDLPRAGPESLHLRTAALQPARPAHRAGAAADGPDLRGRDHPLEPPGGRPAVWQVPPQHHTAGR